MYNPASFREPDLVRMHDLIRQHPLGMLISNGPAGLLASPVPFLLDADAGESGTLRAHLARANPHWQEFHDGGDCLVVFQGEQGYVTPDWYPSKAETHRAVPTWNYAMVQVRGRVTVHEDADWLRSQLTTLTAGHEGKRAQPWSLSEAPEDFIASQMKAIVGLEIAITQIEGKWKMSQNRALPDRQGVIAGLTDPADPHSQPAMGQIVAQRLRESES